MSETASKWATAEAGRELDAAVAERVMGWKPCDRVAMGWGDGPPVWLTGEDRSPTFQDFRPSEEVPHAWMVVESMRAKGKLMSLVQDSDGWYALVPTEATHDFVRGTDHPTIELVGGEGETFVHAKTMPLAVCRAALIAQEAAR